MKRMSETAVPLERASHGEQTPHHRQNQDNDEHRPGFVGSILARLGFAGGTDIRDVIEDALEKEEEYPDDSFLPHERVMLHNLMRFGAVTIEDVMVPRADIVAVDEQASLSELLDVFAQAGHSRIPVYNDTLDDPGGMVHIKDLMSWITTQSREAQRDRSRKKSPSKTTGRKARAAPLRLGGVNLAKSVSDAGIRRDMLFVPPSMSALDLLLRMQSTRIHLALVVDEYGGTDGLVSIEDLIEEIVGEIEDEHDQNGSPLISKIKGQLVADARAPIEELEKEIGFSLLSPDSDEDIDTLGGLVFSIADRVPVRGELIRHESGLEFEVLDADPKRIKKLRIHLLKQSSDSGPRGKQS